MHDISDEHIRDLLIDKGYTDNKAAEFLGVSKSTVSRRREALGISPKPKRPKDYYKISEGDHNKLLSLYGDGKNDYEVATIMHMGRSTLRKWRSENKISSQSNKKGFNNKDAIEMYRLYQSGTTVDQIAKIHGVNRSSVSRLLRRNNLVVEDRRVMPTGTILQDCESVIGTGLKNPRCAVNSVDNFKKLSMMEQEVVLDQYVRFYQERGFPYPRYNLRDIKADIKSLQDSECFLHENVVQGNTFGVKTCNHYFPHRFDGKRYDSDPMSIWGNPEKLREFFRNRFRYADNRISDAVIRTGLQLKGVPANFNPSIAQYIYREFLPESGTVLDFSAGYGGRLLGFLTSGSNGRYYGYEPSVKSYNALVKMSNELVPIQGESLNTVKLFNSPFEDACIDYRSDLVFSSPPYYGLEIYSDEDNQSIVRYPEYNDWLNKFWRVLVDKCSTSLYPGGYFIYTIGNYRSYDLLKDTVEIVKSSGLVLQETYRISYHNVFKNKEKLENVLVFKK